MIVIADTSGTLAALDTAHALSDACLSVMDDAGLTVFSPVVLAEFDHVGRRELGAVRARQTLEDIVCTAARGDFAIASTTADVLHRAQQVQARTAHKAFRVLPDDL